METREIIEFVRRLIENGVFLYLEEGELKYRSKKGSFSDSDKLLVKNNKEAIKNHLLSLEKQTSNAAPNIVELEKYNHQNSRLPLSYAQQRLWFEDKLQKGSAQYNTQGVLFFSAPFNIKAFTDALSSMLERHLVLRTVFQEVEGEPCQVVLENYATQFNEHDISDVSEKELQLRLNELMYADERVSFDLEKELMIRMSLVKIPNSNYIAFYTLHHIAGDGWSMSIFKNEFRSLYEAFENGLVAPLFPLEYQYYDYAIWQRKWLDGEKAKSSLNYWTSYLSGLPAKHSLPLDFPRPSYQSFSGQFFTQSLPNKLVDDIRNICKQEDVTLFMFLQTAFALLIGRVSNENDIVIGAAVAGREHNSLENMIGLFLNILVIRTDLSKNLTFREILRESKKNLLTAYEHQMVPFDMIVEEINPERDLSHNPIVQILFGVQNNEGSHLESTSKSSKAAEGQPTLQGKMSTRFDLKLDVYESNNDFSFTWLFNTSLFMESSISRLADSFVNMLDNITRSFRLEDSKSLSIHELDFVSSKELELLESWNFLEKQTKQNICFHQLFEEQASKNPKSVAVIFDNQELSYQLLNQKANQLANHLITEGVVIGDVIGLNIKRSTDMLIGLLGILKAGAAYLPLDSLYPVERLNYMIQDSNARYLLTTTSEMEKFSDSQVHLICVDEPQVKSSISEAPSCNLESVSQFYSCLNIAYIIYTSGSTGKPKGVAVNHQSLCEFLTSAADEFLLPHIDGSVVSSPLVFDATIGSILVPLINGKFAELLPEEGLALDHLADCLCDDEVNYLFKLTPSHLEAMMTKGYLNKNEYAKHVIVVAGEPLPRETIRYWQLEILPNSVFINEYGPTETTVGATIFPMTRQWLKATTSTTVPIGRALGDKRFYVLNDSFARQSIGSIGELYIASQGVAVGYLNKAGLTAERFVPNPFSLTDGERLYKTGDLVRFTSDGMLEFFGRRDHQIKIRGFRIELNEIEEKILGLSGVIDAAVKVINPYTNNAKIVAYIVNNESANTDHLDSQIVANYKDELQRSLPNYMVPSSFVLMQQLPLTVNGKLDTNSLPLPSEHSITKNDYQKPRNYLEKSICDIWSDILKLERVGIYDNFFDLGGHSLLATRLISSIRAIHQIEIPLKNLFENPILSDFVKTFQQASSLKCLPDIKRRDKGGNIELSFSQRRIWFMDQLAKESSAYNITGLFILPEQFCENSFEEASKLLIQRHKILRTNYVKVGEETYQVVKDVFKVKYECFDYRSLSANDKLKEFQKLYKRNLTTNIKLDTELPINLNLVRLTNQENVVLYTVHHIAFDGWSSKILEKEFISLYKSSINKQDNTLPPLAIQYADYANWHRECLQGEVLTEQLDYWKRALKGVPQLHSLPVDNERINTKTPKGRILQKYITQETAKDVKAFCSRHQVTSFMFFLAVFKLLLARCSKESDIVVGTPVSGRYHEKLENLIGLFVNTLVLRSTLDSEASFVKFLSDVKSTVLQAFNNQSIPFDILVEEINPERSLSHNPLVQVQFSLDIESHSKSHEKLSIYSVNKAVPSPEEIKNVGNRSDVHNNVKDELYLNVKEVEKGMVLSWVYDGNIFSDSSIDNFSSIFNVLLDGVMNDPHLSICEYRMLTKDNEHDLIRVCRSLNQKSTVKHFPTRDIKNIFKLFDHWVDFKPEAKAIECNGEETTYLQLRERVIEIVNYLNQYPVTAEQPIGVCIHHHVDLVATILATLKIGIPYVPIDPKLPKAKIKQLLKASGCKYVILYDLDKKLTSETQLTTILLKNIKLDSNSILEESKIDSIHPDMLAYIIYTSGSSGSPKGVQVTHRALLNYISHTFEEYFSGSIVGSCVASSINFDATITSLLAPIFCGKYVKLLDDKNQLDELSDAIFSSQENLLFKLTPTHLRALGNEAGQQTSEQYHYMILGGEPLDMSLLKLWKTKLLQNSTFINEYGPTETCVGVAIEKIRERQDITKHKHVISIGAGIANVELYIVDADQRLCPLGIPGELLIGGESGARGYLNNSAETADKFVPNSFAAGGDRLYRSGDLVKYLLDESGKPCAIEYIGRLDEQVKIHGARVEPKEIEQVLNGFIKIEGCAVSTFKSENNVAHLIAYLQPSKTLTNFSEQEEYNLIDEVKQYAKDYLPDYLIPQHFQLVERFDLTVNGKLDRSKLPGFTLKKQEYIAPKTRIQKKLCQTWEKLLKVQDVGLESNFFVLGGHSLLASRMVNLINEELGTQLSLRQIFETPTIYQLSKLLEENISISQPRIQNNKIIMRQKQGDAPLSYSQQRLWFIDQLESGSAQYNITEAIIFNEKVSIERLTSSLIRLLNQHEILKTIYTHKGGEPVQRLLPVKSLEIEQFDYSGLDETAAQIEVERLFIKNKHKTFDLECDLLFRPALIKLSDDRFLLIYTLHHISCDAWSLKIIKRDILQNYHESLVSDIPSTSRKIQYSDYSEWQRSWLTSEVIQDGLCYWKKQLADLPDVHQISLDMPRPKRRNFKGNYIRQNVSSELASMISSVCKSQNVTLFMLFHTALSLTISRHSNSSVIAIGSSCSGRGQPELEDLVGFLINDIVIKHRINGSNSFLDQLKESKNTIIDAFTYQHIPFEMLVEELNPQRNLSFNPLFQIKLDVNNEDFSDISQSSSVSDITPGELIDGEVEHFVKHDIYVDVKQGASGLELLWRYDNCIFESDTIKELAKSFSALVSDACNDIYQRVDCLKVLNDDQENQMILSSIGAAHNNGQSKCMHRLFEENAAKRSEEIAIEVGKNTITYEELNSKANKLARYLIKRGANQNTIIPIFFNRSVDMLVSIIAVLKLGAAYLPLDPKLPRQRIKNILLKNEFVFSLTHLELASKLEACLTNTNLSFISIDSDESLKQINRMSNENILEIDSNPNDLAYVIFTSGSTGEPKGVMVEHHALHKFLFYIKERYYSDKLKGCTLATSYAFDLTIPSIFLPLLFGGTIKIFNQGFEIEQVAKFLDEADMVGKDDYIIRLTPSHLAAIIPSLNKKKYIAGHVFVIGGEAFPVNTATELSSYFPNAKIFNQYGPAETTVACSLYRFGNAASALLSNYCPIGLPMAGTHLYVLDSNMQLCPSGAIGELYVGGDGLSRGYLNNASATAERFQANPFDKDGLVRIYKTGDLVRWLRDGNLEFISRIDSQVKINGLRIELGEIEKNLVKNKNIKDCLVLTVNNGKAGNQLAVYILAEKDIALDNTEKKSILSRSIKSSLSKILPDYMIPKYYIYLDEFPLTVNGKVDYSRLPDAKENDLINTIYVEPSNEVEIILCKIWSKHLNRERVGIQDNFFFIGGHSLIAVRVINEIKTEFKIDLGLRAIFEQPTIAELGKIIEQAESKRTLPTLQSFDRTKKIPLSFSQQRIWFIDLLGHGSAQYNMKGSIKLPHEYKRSILEQAISHLIKRHEILRTLYFQEDGLGYQHILSEFSVPIFSFDISNMSQEQSRACLEDISSNVILKPFDLTKEVPIKFFTIKYDDNKHHVFYVLHHIAGDGWSNNILQKELILIYKQCFEESEIQLPPLKYQYADFANWQRELFSEDYLNEQLQFWKTVLHEVPVVHNLPLDRPRPEKQAFEGVLYRQILDLEFSQSVTAYCENHDATLFIFMQTVFALFLGRYSDTDDIVVGTAVAGRDQSELENLIGLFLNILVLRTDLSRVHTFDELLSQNKAMILDAFSYQDVPFEKIVEEVSSQRDLKHNALVQILFGVQNNENQLLSDVSDVSTHGNRVYGEFIDTELTARFDLKLDVYWADNCIVLEWFFDKSLFIKDSIERMTSNFSELVESVIQEGVVQNSIHQLELLARKETGLLLDNWNSNKMYKHANECWYEWFESHSATSPDSQAVVKDEESLSYSELNSRANQLARHLVSLGVKPDDLVAICLHRSIEIVVALLAVNKAGAGYVPIDPSSPKDRIGFILEDCKAKKVITHSDFEDQITEFVDMSICINKEEVRKQLSLYCTSNIPRTSIGLHERNIAYVIYTSGSTGQPKGVITTHRNLTDFLSAANEEFIHSDIKGAVVSSTLVFDATVGSLLLPLSVGLHAEILEEGAVSLEQLSDYLSDDESSYLFKITPSHIEAILNKGFVQNNLNAKHVLVIAGEALASNIIFNGINDLLPNSLLINEYGPTETTVGSTILNISERHRNSDFATVPIGRSLGCTDLYVLSRQKQLMPIGATGELYIGGEGIARGYLNRASLTAEKFIPNPFSKIPGERLYRTGDFVKYISDTKKYSNEIVFIGRVDHQVKIRGYRIELDEIQKQLETISIVRSSVVTSYEHEQLGPSLAAYVIIDNSKEIELRPSLADVSKVIQYIKEQLSPRLPSYMMPNSLMVVDEFNLTLNGKVDMKSLPSPVTGEKTKHEFKSASTDTEKMMCLIWENLLGQTTVGVLDNFFDLGGHSLLATRLISIVREKYKVEVSLRILFENSTVQSFSNRIDDYLLELEMTKNRKTLSDSDDTEEVIL